MIKKLMNLIKNYDKIMKVIEDYDKTPVVKTTTKKSYSLFNTPLEQKEYIEEKMKGKK